MAGTRARIKIFRVDSVGRASLLKKKNKIQRRTLQIYVYVYICSIYNTEDIGKNKMEYIFPGCIARTKRKIRQYVEYSYPSGKTQKVVAAKHHSQQHQQYYDLLRYCVFHDIVVCLFLLPIRSLNRIAVPVYTCEWLINNL